MSMKETDRRWLPAERDALASEAIFALIQRGVTPPGARQHRKESA